MGIIVTKLEETIAHSVALSVVVLNLRKGQLALLQPLLDWFIKFGSHWKMALVQLTSNNQ
jgi:hypothetical protein